MLHLGSRPSVLSETEQMIQETKAFHLLNGWRGGEKYDIEAIHEYTYCKLSQLAMDFPQIQEIEINPLRVFPDGNGALGLDCRMILK